MISVVNYFVLISSVFGNTVIRNQNEAIGNIVDRINVVPPNENTTSTIMMNDTAKNNVYNSTQDEFLENNITREEAVVKTVPEIDLNEPVRNFVHTITLEDTSKNVFHNTTLDESLGNIVHNNTLDESSENIVDNITLGESLANMFHNSTLNKSLGNAVHNTTLTEFSKDIVHNITLGGSSDNIIHNFTLDTSLGNAVHNTTLAESSKNVVHNITLDGPVLPLVFSSLPFLFLRPSTTPYTNDDKFANTKAYTMTDKTKPENGTKSSGHVTFPPSGFNLFPYKNYPWDMVKQGNSSRIKSAIPNKKPQQINSRRMGNLISAIKHPKQPNSSRMPPNIISAILDTKHPHQTNSSRMPNLINAIIKTKYSKHTNSSRMSNLMSAVPTARHSYSMSEILDFLDRSTNLALNLSTSNIIKNNGSNHLDIKSGTIPGFKNRAVWRYLNGSIPGKMSNLMGTVQHEPQGRILTGSDVKAEDDGMESLLRSSPQHTRPLIYFRQFSENETSARAPGVAAAAPKFIISGVLSAGDPHVCITRCPGSLVAIEMVIEHVAKVCTGILLVDNFVLTGGSCIPPDWRSWFASHPGEIKLTPLFDTETSKITVIKVRYFNSQGQAWPEHTDVVVLKVETGPDLGGLQRSTFDPTRMWVQDSECYLYVFKEKHDGSVLSFSERKTSEQEYAYYYEEDYEEAKGRKFDLVKIRVSNLMNKPNRTVLSMNTSQLVFSVFRKPYNFTTGVVYCADSFDSLLYSSVQGPASSVLVFLNLSSLFYDLNRFVFAFHPSMMHLHKHADYLNVDDSGRGMAALCRAHLPLLLLVSTLLVSFT